LDKVQRLRDLHVSLHPYRMYSSSLLFVYEGDDSAPQHVELCMIDLARTHDHKPEHEVDDGYLFGMANLIKTLQSIANMTGDDTQVQSQEQLA
jgi:hypothetical protein